MVVEWLPLHEPKISSRHSPFLLWLKGCLPIQFLETYHMNKYHIKRIVCGVYNVMISDFRRLNRGVYDILEYK